MSLIKAPVLFLDIQTTGAKPDKGAILEIAWSFTSSEKIESALIEQEKEIPRRIQIITGIKNEDLKASLPLAEVLVHLKSFIEQYLPPNPVAVIHFAQFEKPFLQDAYQKIDQDLPFSILCTYEISKRLFPNLPTRGIKGLAGYFGCPSGDYKRAASHVKATQIIWQGLAVLLEQKGVSSLDSIDRWLHETPKVARGKYEYPLPKDKRLNLPKQPGVYRMLSRWGEVLYVGKATSLHDRVNSYFRGQKNRDTKKLEMLTQVWDLNVTPLASPLEAALLETDEIKKLNPPYNISLKTGQRALAFFNHDFTSSKAQVDEEHHIGPFSNSSVLDSMIRLSQSLREGSFDEHLFYESIDSDLLEAGFNLFCEQHGLDKNRFTSVRSILAVGVNWYRHLIINKEGPVLEDQIILEDSDSDSDEDPDEAPETALTPEDLAEKFERHFIRSAASYLRTKKLTRLLNIDLRVDDNLHLKIHNGKILDPESPLLERSNSWRNLSVDTYDRMTVLLTELNKLGIKF